MKLNQLLEQLSDIDITKDVKSYDKADKNDWFYDYALSFIIPRAVSKVYNSWKKENPNKFPSAFIYEWKSIAADGKYHGGDELYKNRHSISDVEDIESEISWNSAGEPSIDTLDLSEVVNNPQFTVPKFKFGEVSHLVLDDNSLSEYPDWGPKKVNTLLLRDNNFTSLSKLDKNLHECQTIDLRGNPVSSSVLSVFKITGLKNVALDNSKVANIVNEHLETGKDIFDCQEALIDAGLQEFAKL